MHVVPVLATDGLLLRPWALSDVDFVVAAASDPDIGRYSSVGVAQDPATARAWVESRREHDRLDWVVERDGFPVGRVSLAHIDTSDGAAEVGYWTLPTHRRRGLATAAVGAIETHAFDVLDIARLYIRHEPENVASCALALSRGYLAEGTQRGAFSRAGARRDLHVHGLLVTDPRLSAVEPQF